MKVLFFQKEGESPPYNFLQKLPLKIRARFYRYLEHLAQDGGKIEGIAFKKLYGYPMEEIRIKSSSFLHRLILHIKKDEAIFVLHGFSKKEGEKTPAKELKIAYKNLKLFLSEVKYGKK
jgi:phage-related protein